MQLRTTIAVYHCNERNELGAKGTPMTLGGAPISGNLYFLKKKSPKQTNILDIDASSLLIGPMPGRAH